MEEASGGGEGSVNVTVHSPSCSIGGRVEHTTHRLNGHFSIVSGVQIGVSVGSSWIRVADSSRTGRALFRACAKGVAETCSELDGFAA